MKFVRPLLRLFCSAVVFATTLSAAEPRLVSVVPVVGSTGGLNGANFKTGLQLQNPSDAPSSGWLVFRPLGVTEYPADAGAPRMAWELAARQTKSYDDVVADMGQSGLGSLDVIVENGAAPNAIARAFDDGGANGTKGVTVPAMPPDEAITVGQTAALVAPMDPNRSRLNLGLRTLSEGAIVQISLFEADGTLRLTLPIRTYAADYFVQQPSAAFLVLPPSLKVEANESISITVLEGSAFFYATHTDNKTNDPSIQIAEKHNHVPTSAGITAAAKKDTAVTIRVSAEDPDNENLLFTLATAPAHGTLGAITRIDGHTIEVVYTPAPGFTGADSLVFLVEDENGGSTLATATIAVGGNDSTPTAVDATVTVLEDRMITITLRGIDADGDTLSFAIAAGAEDGSLGPIVVTGPDSATVTYRPRADFDGSDSFTFSVSDGEGSDTGKITINISSVPDAPDSTNDSFSLLEDGVLNVAPRGVLTNDHDPENETLTAQLVSTTANGTLVLNANGSFTYTPNANYFGSDSFTYRASDGALSSGTATVTISVTAVNDAPSFTASLNATSNEDAGAQSVASFMTAISAGPNETAQTLTFNITGNDNPTLFVSGPSIAADGTLTYTAAPNANGTANITVTLSDNGGTANGGVNTSAGQSFTITVNAVNDAPTFSKGGDQTVLEDSGAQMVSPWATGMSAGPADESSQLLTFNVTGNTNPALFSAGPTVLPDGSLQYTPAADANGSATITLTLTDDGGTANGGVDTSTPPQTFVINVTPVNDEPSFTAGPGVTVDEDSGAFSGAHATAMNAGVNEAAQSLDFIVSNDNNALFSVQPAIAADGTLTFTPAANANGSTIVTVAIHDDGGTANGGDDTSDSQTFTITVTPVDDAPLAVNDAGTVNEDDPATAVDVLTNDTDIDAGPMTIASVTQPPNGAVVITGGGTGLTYQPNANFCGQNTFTYTLNGGSVGTVTMTVTCVDDLPTAVNDNAVVSEDAPATAIDVLANDTDVDAGPKSITAVTQPGNGTVVITGGGTGLTYQPNANFCGALEVFTYTLNGGSIGTVSVTVNCVDDPPVAVTDAANFTEDDPATAINVLGNDTDGGDGGPVTIASVTQGTNGAVVITGGGTGLTYQPNANFCGADSFTYTLNGGSIATVNVTVGCVDDDPTAVNDALTINEDAAATAVNVLANDLDPDGGSISITAITQGTNGVVVITGGGTGLTYAPNSNFCGSDTFTYTLTPGGTTATVTMTVTCVNDAPVANPDNYSVARGGSLLVPAAGVITNDTDVEGATLSSYVVATTTHGSLALNADGSFHYVNDGSAFLTDSFTYQLTDGSANAPFVTVTITITQSNLPPEAMSDSYNVVSGGTLTTTAANGVLQNDTDPEGAPMTAVLVGNVSNGTLTLNADGSFEYVNDGAPVQSDSFSYQANDGQANSGTVTVIINLTVSNSAPVAVNDTYNVAKGGTLTVSDPGVIGNDTDADGDSLTATIVNNAQNGVVTLNADGSFTYEHDDSATTTDTFTYTVSDGQATSNIATVTITIHAVNTPPVAVPDGPFVTNEDVVFNNAAPGVLSNDTDADGDALTAIIVTQPANGTVVLNSDGSFVYNPAPDFSGSDSFTYKANDGLADSNTVTVSITVNNLNDAPTLSVSGNPTFNENGAAVALAAIATITDPDDTNIESATVTITNVQAGDILNFVNTPNITGSYAAGVLTLTGSDTEAAYVAALQSITFSNASDNPSITQRSLAWVVNDGDTDSNTATTTVDVTATNDGPMNTVPSGLTTNEDTPLVINGASIADPDADPDDVQLTLNVTGGTVTLDPTATGALTSLTGDGTNSLVVTGTVAEINDAIGGMTFTPTADSNGTASIQLATNDLGNNPSGAITDTDSFDITVNAVNDPPSFTPGTDITVPEDAGNVIAPNWATNRSKGPADESGQVLTFTVTVTGTTGGLTFQTAPAVSGTTGTLTFRADANTCGTATVDITLTDDAGTPGVPGDDVSGPTHTLNLTIQCVNDDPSFTKGADQTVDEDAGAQIVNPWATGISPGSGETDALTFNVSNNNNALFTAGGQPAVSATGVLTYTPAPNANGTTIVTVTLTDDAGTPGVPGDDITTGPQTFNITVNAVNDVPAFTIAGNPPFIILGAGAQTVPVFAAGVTDGDPELTQVLTFNFTQTANTGSLTLSAGPTIDPSTGNLTYTPNAGTHGTLTFSVTLSDNGPSIAPNVNVSGAQSFTIVVEKGPEVTTTVPFNGASGVSTSTNITVNFDQPVSVTMVPATFRINCNAGPDLGFAYVGSTVNVTTVTLDPTATLPAGNCVVTVFANEVHDTDAHDPPDGLAADYVFSFVTNTPPVAVDDNTTALGHVTLTVADAQGVLGNDVDPDAGADLDVQNFGTPIVTAQGGTITFTQNGGYTYNSQAMDQNLTDTVNYTVTDQFGGTDTGQLTINLGPRFIYVDDNHPTVTPDGRDIHPWKTMQQAQANSAAGDTILVMEGSYTDHIVLQAGQSLIGQGIAANHTVTHNAVNFTVLTPGAAPTIIRASAGDAITLSVNNTVRGVYIGTTNGKGIVGNNFITVTINEVTVNTNGHAALHLDTGAVTATLNSVTATSGPNSGLIFNNLTGTMNINGGLLSNTAGATLNLTGGSMAGTIAANFLTAGNSLINVANRTANALTLSGALNGSGTIAASGNAAGTTLTFSGTQTLSTGVNVGVNLSANPGTISFIGGALQISTTSGSGFVASGATGNVNVTGANNTITTGTGIPLQMTGGVDIGGSGMTFSSISANGAASGIVLADTGASSFNLNGPGGSGSGGTLQSIAGAAVSLTNTNNVHLHFLTINGAATGISGTTFGALTLRELVISAVSGLALNTGSVNNFFGSNAIASMTTTGGTNGVSLTAVNGSFNVAAGSLSGATGSTFLVNGGNVGGTWTTSITQGNNAAALDISNGHSGAFTFPMTVSATNGSGLQFSNADGNYNFSGAATLSGGAGIDVLAGGDAVNGSQGTFTWDGDSSIGNTTGQLIDIQGSKPTFTYSGTFTKTNPGIGIRALNNTGGSITIDGNGAKAINVNSGAANAIDLDNNDGMSITFSNGGLDIDATSGVGFNAVNGGTVVVSGTNNTVTATAGVGVRVTDTTIGVNDMAWLSVNASGGVNGINLTNTGNVGTFTVLGNNTLGSGGTISGTSGDGILLSNAHNVTIDGMNITNAASAVSDQTNCHFENASGCQSAIDLIANSSNVVLDQIVIDQNDGGQMGISGDGVNNLTVTNVQILEVGNADAESGVVLENASGDVFFTDVTIDDPVEYGIRVFQTNASLDLRLTRVTVQNNLAKTFGEQGFSIRATGTSVSRVLVDDCDFLNTDGIGVDGQAIDSAVLHLTVQNSTFTENRALPMALNFTTDNTSQGFVKIHNNIVTDPATATNGSVAFDLDANRTSTLHSIITNNTINGTGIGSGIELLVGDGSTSRAEVRDNIVTLNNDEIGMTFGTRYEGFVAATNARLDVTIEGNTINNVVNPGGAFVMGVQLLAGSSIANPHTGTVCVNTATAALAGNNSINGTNSALTPKFEVRQRTGTTFQIQGFAGTGTNAASVASHFDANNSGTAGPTFVGTGGTNILNYTAATCNTPTTPTLPN